VFPLSSPLSRRRDARSPLALAAALAVAVPGFLVTSCSGQAGTGGSSPEVSAAASREAGNAGRVPAARKQSRAHAMRLLTQAAQSAIGMSYQGEEVVTRWNNGGGSVLVSRVWHVSGGRTVTQTMAAGTSFSSEPYMSSDTDGQAPEGVLGVTAPLVQLLDAHYLVMYAGTGSAGSRPAQVVEAWRADGSLAARFWLDDATKLPLEREVFDSAVRVISQDVFFDVRLASSGPKAVGSVPADAPADPDGPWTDPLSKAQLLALHSRGWQVPSALPGGLSLFTGAQTTTSTGTVLGLGYSDGLSVVSVFEQRGNLAARLAGWQKTTVGGHPVYVAGPDQRSLTWACRGMVYTVMADAPPQVTGAVVSALPHDGPPGFWKRISRGFARLATIVNPFG
jgi:sigma-E factor negative regulatory protein RseB